MQKQQSPENVGRSAGTRVCPPPDVGIPEGLVEGMCFLVLCVVQENGVLNRPEGHFFRDE